MKASFLFQAMRRAGALWTAGLLLLPAGSIAAPSAPRIPVSRVVPQDIPELTDEIFEKYSEFVYALMDIKPNIALRGRHRQFVENYWQKGMRKNIETVLTAARLYDQVMAKPSEEQMLFFHEVRADTIKNIRKASKEGDPESKWLEGVYYAQHPIIAQGAVPLTRDIVDDNIELARFEEVEVQGKRLPPLTASARQTAYREWAKVWTNLPTIKQQQAASMQGKAAILTARWNAMGREDRLLARYRLGGGRYMSASERMLAQQLEQKMTHMMKTHANTMITNELNHMRQNQQIIMGSGTYWNPSTNRWEQRGGIVTEYH